MHYILLVLLLGWALPVWANYQKTPGTPFDLSGLTSEFKQAVPDLEGCDDTHGTITCRRLTGDFTEAEKALMEAVLAAHDPNKPLPADEQEIPLADFGGLVGGLAGAASLVIVARKKKVEGR